VGGAVTAKNQLKRTTTRYRGGKGGDRELALQKLQELQGWKNRTGEGQHQLWSSKLRSRGGKKASKGSPKRKPGTLREKKKIPKGKRKTGLSREKKSTMKKGGKPNEVWRAAPCESGATRGKGQVTIKASKEIGTLEGKRSNFGEKKGEKKGFRGVGKHQTGPAQKKTVRRKNGPLCRQRMGKGGQGKKLKRVPRSGAWRGLCPVRWSEWKERKMNGKGKRGREKKKKHSLPKGGKNVKKKQAFIH